MLEILPSGEAVAPPDSWTIQRILTWSTGFLQGRGFESARLDAELLLGAALGLTRMQLYTSFDKPLAPEERDPFKELLRRRAAGEPVAYITGTKEFFSLAFQVTPDVLIPRPDTECLVEAALAEVKRRRAAADPAETPEPLRILDVGTGSGCIALALAKRLPQAALVAWDVSEAALAIARANAARLGITTVSFERRDALDAAAWDTAPFDLIVSNPPYVAESERAALPVSVVRYEPGTALFAANDGLHFYETFARCAPGLLRPGGMLLVEIGATQGAPVRALFEAAGLAQVAVTKDYAKLDRVASGRV